MKISDIDKVRALVAQRNGLLSHRDFYEDTARTQPGPVAVTINVGMHDREFGIVLTNSQISTLINAQIMKYESALTELGVTDFD